MVLERVDFLFNECVVLVDLLEPAVRGCRPARGDAKEWNIVVDLAAGHVEDGVVRLPDEERAHGVEARVTDGLAVLVGAFVCHEVCHFLEWEENQFKVL